jgi:hypothetical protein
MGNATTSTVKQHQQTEERAESHGQRQDHDGDVQPLLSTSTSAAAAAPTLLISKFATFNPHLLKQVDCQAAQQYRKNA